MKYGLALTRRGSNLQRTGLALAEDRYLRPSHRGRVRIDNLDVEIHGRRRGDRRRKNRNSKEKQQKTRMTHTILLYTRKCYRRLFTTVSWLASKDADRFLLEAAALA